jgi:aromatic ring hydroxylase
VNDWRKTARERANERERMKCAEEELAGRVRKMRKIEEHVEMRMKRSRRAQAVVALALGLDNDDLAKWMQSFEDRIRDSVVEDVEDNEMRNFKLPQYLQECYD